MASLFQRCRPILCGHVQCARRQVSRQRPHTFRPFSSTALTRKDEGGKTPESAPSRRKLQYGLDAVLGKSDVDDAQAESEEADEDEEDFDEMYDEGTEDIARMQDEWPPEEGPVYDEDGLDEFGNLELEKGDRWVDRRRGISQKMLDAFDAEASLGEEKYEEGFFALGNEREDAGPDPEFENDDITSMAHGELEQHRELREFYRVIAWDMPLLFNHRKAYEPATAAQPLRFRYTTYMGETHPAARKVVVDFTPSALPNLSEKQAAKLIKLLGTRYNPGTDRAKISCEMFPTVAQNKRWLGDMLDKLSAEARDGKDTFEDVPFDYRHYKPKKRIEFPEEWKMTDARRAYLDGKRQELEQRQAQLLIEENSRAEEAAAQLASERDAVPVPAQRMVRRPTTLR